MPSGRSMGAPGRACPWGMSGQARRGGREMTELALVPRLSSTNPPIPPPICGRLGSRHFSLKGFFHSRRILLVVLPCCFFSAAPGLGWSRSGHSGEEEEALLQIVRLLRIRTEGGSLSPPAAREIVREVRRSSRMSLSMASSASRLASRQASSRPAPDPVPCLCVKARTRSRTGREEWSGGPDEARSIDRRSVWVRSCLHLWFAPLGRPCW